MLKPQINVGCAQVAADGSKHLANVASISRSRGLRAARLSSLSPPRLPAQESGGRRLGSGGSLGSNGVGGSGRVEGSLGGVKVTPLRETLAARARLIREATAP